MTVESALISALVSLHGVGVCLIGCYTSLIRDCSPLLVISAASKPDLVNIFAF